MWPNICDPLSENPALPANIEFFLLNLDYYTCYRGLALVNYEAWLSYYKTIQATTHRQVTEIRERVTMDSLVHILSGFTCFPVCILLSFCL